MDDLSTHPGHARWPRICSINLRPNLKNTRRRRQLKRKLPAVLEMAIRGRRESQQSGAIWNSSQIPQIFGITQYWGWSKYPIYIIYCIYIYIQYIYIYISNIYIYISNIYIYIQYIYIYIQYIYISNIYCISIYTRSISTMAFESHLQYPSDLTCAVPMFLGGTRRTWFPEGRDHFPSMVG